MDRKQVLPGKSSQIVSIGFDKEQKILEIEFSSGGVYDYFGVPESLYEEFIRADSLGVFVGTKIRGAFEYKRLHDGDCATKDHLTVGDDGCTCWCHRLTKTSRETEKPSEKEKPAKKQKKTRPAI